MSELVWPLQVWSTPCIVQLDPERVKVKGQGHTARRIPLLGFRIGIQMDGFVPRIAPTVGGKGFCVQRKGAERSWSRFEEESGESREA